MAKSGQDAGKLTITGHSAFGLIYSGNPPLDEEAGKDKINSSYSVVLQVASAAIERGYKVILPGPDLLRPDIKTRFEKNLGL